VPVLTVDGPTASGKGTLASELARRLGFHLLDSGALYRATALAAQDAGVSLDDEAPLAELAGRLALRFEGQRVYLAGRTSPTRCAWNPPAAWPRGCRCTRRAPGPAPAAAVLPPGPGPGGRWPRHGHRDLPRRPLKVFLTASVEQRAERRYKQLISKGISANLHRFSLTCGAGRAGCEPIGCALQAG
jgi:3-phosphoshikimate 1-carboxyvinyltransferase